MAEELFESRIHKWVQLRTFDNTIDLVKEIGSSKRGEVLQMLKRLHDFDAWYFDNFYIEFSEDFTKVTKKRYVSKDDILDPLRFKF